MFAASGLLARTATKCLDQALFFAGIADRSTGGIEADADMLHLFAALAEKRAGDALLPHQRRLAGGQGEGGETGRLECQGHPESR